MKRLLIILLIIITLACKNNSYRENKKLRLGIPLQPTSGILIIADENQYFKEFGLEVMKCYYPSGKRALLEGLLKDKCDMITAADVPFAINCVNYNDLKIITAISRGSFIHKIIARTDQKIKKPEDLKGKIIATQRFSAVHFFPVIIFTLSSNR